MKFFVKIVLVLFIAFIAMPTVVGILDKKVDTSYFYNINEEEESLSTFNEIKMISYESVFFAINFIESPLKKKFICRKENMNGYFSTSIFLPPPELI